MKYVVNLLTVTLLYFGIVRADFWFGTEKKPHPVDGGLRCYQCDTKVEEEKKVAMPVCDMGRWKLANSSEKRTMMTHCPRRMSAFCMLVVDKKRTIRGCYGLHYRDKSQPHYGCFRMDEGDTKRVCLCNTDLCNVAGRSVAGLAAVVVLALVVLYIARK